MKNVRNAIVLTGTYRDGHGLVLDRSMFYYKDGEIRFKPSCYDLEFLTPDQRNWTTFAPWLANGYPFIILGKYLNLVFRVSSTYTISYEENSYEMYYQNDWVGEFQQGKFEYFDYVEGKMPNGKKPNNATELEWTFVQRASYPRPSGARST